MKRWEIYALADPITGHPRYVGITFRGVNNRYREHLYSVGRRGNNSCSAWLESLGSRGLKPSLLVLESGTGVGWEDGERFWIETICKDYQLTNHPNSTYAGNGFCSRIGVPTLRQLNQFILTWRTQHGEPEAVDAGNGARAKQRGAQVTWAERIKSARMALRQANEPAVSREALARLLEKSTVTIHGWEHGKHEPRGYERERVIKRLAELVSRAGTRRSMETEIKPCD